ncbi:MAG: endopeptidase La [Deltaproteobacteria bacterium]|nr:endopeptidase La [Deltaproteobacteria bacterium]
MEEQRHGKNAVEFPRELPILPLRNMVAYPLSVVPLLVGIPRSVKLIEDALSGDKLIGLVGMPDSSVEKPQPGQTYEVGTVARVDRVVKSSDNTLQVMVHGLERFKIDHWLEADPYLRAEVEALPDQVDEGVELDALQRSLSELSKEVVKLSPSLPDEITAFLDRITDPLNLVYVVAGNAGLEVKDAQEVLEAHSATDKMRILIQHLTREKEVLNLGRKIESETKQTMDKAQKEFYLRQQLKTIQKELGEEEAGSSEADEYRQKLEDADLPEEVQKEAERELKRMSSMSPQSPEYSVIRTYLDWIVELPWRVSSEDRMDMEDARKVLDEDHYDLEDVKDRIIEYLAVRKLVREREIDREPSVENDGRGSEGKGAILCFVGPPGVGKTSLGQSIARALGRKFTRMSLGGMRDEAEIRGHRRTYVGAMPGRIIQALKRAGTRNPVFMLDEVDKVGADWRGDPSSALLEVLDPAQNHAFRDHYLDVDFDLSDVIFITTANQLETIPAPLRDRMETLHLEGYTELEKLHIARKYLVPRQLRANGLLEDELTFTDEALLKIIGDYTREAGVRNLERQIGSVCRKCAVKIAGRSLNHDTVTPELVRVYLKKERFESESSEEIEIPGIATGLAVTAVGGDILFIEATGMKGKCRLTLTGQLGDVMRESAQIAQSYVRSKASRLGVDPEAFEQTDVHVHVPAGAIPKDGPSAGLPLVLAMASLFSGRPVRGDVGMTGEVTLRGRVLPVGGIKMKVLAAHRAGLKTVILPRRNERDLDELPEEVRRDIRFIPVDLIDEALNEALEPEARRQTDTPPAAVNG